MRHDILYKFLDSLCLIFETEKINYFPIPSFEEKKFVFACIL